MHEVYKNRIIELVMHVNQHSGKVYLGNEHINWNEFGSFECEQTFL